MDKTQMRAIVLAAGKGKRLREGESDTQPKVMKKLVDRPLIGYVLEELSFIQPSDITVVVGYGRQEVIDFLGGKYGVAVQENQLGTGHAVAVCYDRFTDYSGLVLVCCGDTPLVLESTYRALIDEHMERGSACTILTARAPDPQGYGRIIRDGAGNCVAIREQRDCTEEESAVTEINAGIFVFDSKKLFESLEELTPDNAQNEYYLTDVPQILLGKGERVGTYTTADFSETLGINTVGQLSEAESIMKGRKK